MKKLVILLFLGVISHGQALAINQDAYRGDVNTALDDEGQVIYQMLAAEIALKEQYEATAFNVYLSMAKRLKNPVLAERALEIALMNNLLPKALAATRLWSTLAPSSTDAKAITALLYVKAKQNKDAKPYMAELIKDGSPNAGLMLKMVNHLETDWELKAMDSIMAGLEKHRPSDPIVHFTRAYIAKKSHHFEFALDEINQALKLKPQWAEAIALYTEILSAKSKAPSDI